MAKVFEQQPSEGDFTLWVKQYPQLAQQVHTWATQVLEARRSATYVNLSLARDAAHCLFLEAWSHGFLTSAQTYYGWYVEFCRGLLAWQR